MEFRRVSVGEVSLLDHFEDQFLADNPDHLGLNFEDEAKFFDPVDQL